MKLVIERDKERYTIEFRYDDVSIEEMARAFASLLISAGWSIESVKTVFMENSLPLDWDSAWKSSL